MNEKLFSPLILNQTNALILNSVEHYKTSILSSFWHKFIIHDGANLDSKLILKSIVNCGGDIFPIQYELEGEDTSFIARNCKKAIENLCACNLVLKYAKDKPPVQLSIHVNKGVPNKTTLNIQNVIAQVLRKRYSKETAVLNLENFVNDPDLINKVYCAISQTKVLMFVLSLAKDLGVRCLRLNNNEIKHLDGLEVIVYCSFNLLYSIDLRNNLISDISELNFLKKFYITELWLDDNPVCDMYENYNYILMIRDVCPKIKKIDGEELFKNDLPILRRNYSVKYSSLNLVDQFLEHYFKLYDTNRELLIDFYHSEALFSLTTSLIPNQITSSTQRLDEFKRINRNLLNKEESTSYEKWLFHSREDIVKILCKLSASEHDPYSFTVDVLYHSRETIVIHVTGVFREGSSEINYNSTNLLNFSRTFVLIATPDDGYHIINEQLFISNATTSQVKTAFQVYDENKSKITAEEQSYLTETMVEICETDIDTAKRLLELTKWDLKSSLTLFVDQTLEQLSVASKPSSPPPNYTINPSSAEMQNQFLQISNQPIGIQNPFVGIPAPFIGTQNPSLENQYPYSGIPYLPHGVPNNPYEIPNQFFGNPNPSYELSNPPHHFLNNLPSPQSSQITSTTNEMIIMLPEKKRRSNIIRIQAAKSQSVPIPELRKKEKCDVCFYIECHRNDCPKHPNNIVTQSSTSCSPAKINKQEENDTSDENSTTTELKSDTVITEMYSYIKKLELESKSNKQRKRTLRCGNCRRRGHTADICTENNSNSKTTSAKINKDGEKTVNNETTSATKTLQEISQPTKKIIINLKSNNLLKSDANTLLSSEETLKDSSKAIQSTETDKTAKIEDATIKQELENSSESIKKEMTSESDQNTECNDKSTNPETKMNANVVEVSTSKNKDGLRPICWYCSKKRHELYDCAQRKLDMKEGAFKFEKAFSTPIEVKKLPPTSNIQTISTESGEQKVLLCNFCGQQGHMVAFCNKLKTVVSKIVKQVENRQQFVSVTRAGVYKCGFCGKQGHTRGFCKKLKAEMVRIITATDDSETIEVTTPDGKKFLLCQHCQLSGHLKRNCRLLKKDLEILASNGKISEDSSKTMQSTKSEKSTKVQKLENSSETIISETDQNSESKNKNTNSKTKNANVVGVKKDGLPPVCWYCNKKRHELYDCAQRKLDMKNGTFKFEKAFSTPIEVRKIPPASNIQIISTKSGEQKVLVCNSCGQQGHIVAFCNKLKTLISQIIMQVDIRKQLVSVIPDRMYICSFCENYGHTIRFCDELKAEMMELVTASDNSEIIEVTTPDGKKFKLCQHCQLRGHSKSNCAILKKELQILASNKAPCEHCKQSGHKINSCRKYLQQIV